MGEKMDEGRRRFGEKILLREKLIQKACELSMKAHKYCTGSQQYIYDDGSSSPEAVFAFAGSWSANQWFNRTPFGEAKIDLDLFPSLRSIANEEDIALVNEAFVHRFEAIINFSFLKSEVENAVKERKQIVFAGHSSGGPLAMLTTLWFLETYTKKDQNTSPPRCVTFGSPLIGDRIFQHAIRREDWARYFIHFVVKYDIVPLITLSPFSSAAKDDLLPRVVDFFNPNSKSFKNIKSISTSNHEVSTWYMNVLINASSVASQAACNLMGCRNLLVKNFSSFIDLSPYRPFGIFVFCAENGKLIVVENPDAVLQMLVHFSVLSSVQVPTACQKLDESFVYGNILQRSLQQQNVMYWNCPSDEVEYTNWTLDDLGLSTRGKLCLRAAEELEKQKLQNEKNIDRERIKDGLNTVEEFKRDSELKKVGYYDAFKLQTDNKHFKANVARLELAEVWDEIVDMLKRYELPDRFEGEKDWIKLGTEFRRLVEPLDVANYYGHGRNDEAGTYFVRGRPKRYRIPQRWLEHDARMSAEIVSDSCFWAEVEEIQILRKKMSYEEMKGRIISLETKILGWDQAKLLGKDVFLAESTLTKWWKSLPNQHKLESSIRKLFEKKSTDGAIAKN